MKKRIRIIDLWRFIAAILIMIHHLYLLGYSFEERQYLGYFSLIFVEFFFIITGYFTCLHFERTENKDIFKSSLEYLVYKFLPFLPYTTIAITLQYIVSAPINSGLKAFLANFLNYPFEVLLLGEVHVSFQKLAPIWFLSAMLLTLPVITIISQLKNKNMVLLISGLTPLFYYGQSPTTYFSRIWPDDLLRAVSGMLLGVFICTITKVLKEKKLMIKSKKTRCIMTLLEVFCLLFVLIATIFNFRSLKNLVILSFALSIFAMLSGYSYSAELNCTFFTYLGKISMPIFIWHGLVASALNRLNSVFDVPVFVSVVLYFLGTLLVSIVSFAVVEHLKKKRKRKHSIDH